MSNPEEKNNEPISDDQLNDVSGGFNPQPDPPGRTSSVTTDPPAPDKLANVIGSIKLV